tara:strand:+ start:163 stop:333 length:171 start_codon:yes stop_codon:yes gene_type:complete
MKKYNNRIQALKLEIEKILVDIESAENNNKFQYAKRLKKIVEIKEKKLNKWIKLAL